MQTFAQYVASLNLDESLLSESRRAALMAAWRIETGQAETITPATGSAIATQTADSPFREEMKKRQADLDREKAITDACTAAWNAHPGQTEAIGKLGEMAIANGWDRTKTEIELIRRFDRANVGQLVNRQNASADPALLEIALLKNMAIDVENKYCRFTPEQIQRTDDQYGRNGLSLGEVLLAVARQNGYRGQTFSSANLKDVLTYSSLQSHQLMSSGGVPSMYSIPNTLANVANKIATLRFNSEDQTWRKICSIASAKNFQLRTDISLLGGFEFLDLGKNAEIKHATIGEQVYTNKLGTKAIMLGIPREDLINDDAGVLEGKTTKMARGANQTLSRAVWRKLLTAPTTATGVGFEFNVAYGNAGTAALDTAGLKTAMTLWGNQLDPDGNPLEVEPKFLIVGSGLRWDANNLMTSGGQVITGPTDKAVGDKNVFQGLAEVVYSPHVSNAAMGGSATRWYLMADPNVLPTLEVLFLNNQQEPIIETVEMNVNLLGIVLRGVYDLGVGLVEKKAAQKNN